MVTAPAGVAPTVSRCRRGACALKLPGGPAPGRPAGPRPAETALRPGGPLALPTVQGGVATVTVVARARAWLEGHHDWGWLRLQRCDLHWNLKVHVHQGPAFKVRSAAAATRSRIIDSHGPRHITGPYVVPC